MPLARLIYVAGPILFSSAFQLRSRIDRIPKQPVVEERLTVMESFKFFIPTDCLPPPPNLLRVGRGRYAAFDCQRARLAHGNSRKVNLAGLVCALRVYHVRSDRRI
ncbi:hypothetical protein EV126DRAFT_420746 [Verticillium dahliae]|nr:hypothetical protein EV126DRAFT_420746 [Verticillium dahliae]